MEKLMLLYFPEYKLRFVKVPKNACSTIISTLGYSVTGGRNPHGFDHVFMREMPGSSEWPIIGVYRDPYDRLVSAYLNKIVAAGPEEKFASDVIDYIWQSQRGESRPYGGLSVTLREFATYVCGHKDEELDQHWRSQSSFFEVARPNVFFDMARLDEQWGSNELTSAIALRRHDPHSAKSTLPFGQYLADLSGEHINGFQQITGSSPEKSRFYDHHIDSMVHHRFANDYDLIASLRKQ